MFIVQVGILTGKRAVVIQSGQSDASPSLGGPAKARWRVGVQIENRRMYRN